MVVVRGCQTWGDSDRGYLSLVLEPAPSRRVTARYWRLCAKTAYAHGGISLQECVIPDLMIERGDEAATAEITEIVWRGMRAAASRSKGTHATFRWICD